MFLGMPKERAVVGKRFAKLVIVERLGYRKVGTRMRRFFRCRCDCGNELELIYGAFSSGGTKSCGCYKLARQTTHGQSKTQIYAVWRAMHDRCTKPRCSQYKNYGARGISVCARWSDFTLFRDDMGPRPQRGTLERDDVNGNYEPSNCRWATYQEQANNTRKNRVLVLNGVSKTIAEWARETGIAGSRLRHRIQSGWTAEEALTKGWSRGERRDLRAPRITADP